MSQLLQKAQRINRMLKNEATAHVFEIAHSLVEEEKIVERMTDNECLTILRLYEQNIN